ncbi:cold-shock protein [Spirillospora sp. NPDC127200]
MSERAESDVATGVVIFWHDTKGWGAISSHQVPGDVWAHFSMIVADGYRALEAGQKVRFTWERATQDNFNFRAVQVWPTAE